MGQAFTDQDGAEGRPFLRLGENFGNQLLIKLDQRGKLRQRLFDIAGIKRRDMQKIGFGITGKKPLVPVNESAATWRHHPPVKLVAVRQAFIAVVLRHLQLVQAPSQKTGDKKHPAAQQKSAAPGDATVFLLLDLLAHALSRKRLNAIFGVDRIT